MYLKSLTLRGFKSFADRTQLTFDPGLTVVVGPNGTGKSNVSDAILWVLGEQSAKALRGQAMEDVIFSGSSSRKAVGLAEVTLVLDNTDHTLPVDFTEVGITRRMYRTGESEYLINGTPARLRDIQDILHDSGLGKDTHSIISQGRLDSVLASRPEDRRVLIEEAADIAKHRRRRLRSERRLSSMQDNLVRARDMVRELHRQLRPLERQVEHLKRSEELHSELALAKTQLIVDDLRRLQASWKTLEAREHEAQAAEELARYRLGERTRELEKLQSLLEQKGLFVGDLDLQRRRAQSCLRRIESDMRLLEEKGQNMVSRLSDMRRSLSASERELTDARSERCSTQNAIRDTRVEQQHLSDALKGLTSTAQDARSKRERVEEHLGEINRKLTGARKKSDTETLAAARIRETITNAEVKDSLMESSITRLEQTELDCTDSLESATAREREGAQSLEQVQADMVRLTASIESLSRDVSEFSELHDSVHNKLNQARSSLAALTAVDAAAHSSNPLVAKIASQQEEETHIRCRLSDLVRVPTSLERAVELLLGEDLMAFVVPDTACLVALARFAAQQDSLAGSASFVRMGELPSPAEDAHLTATSSVSPDADVAMPPSVVEMTSWAASSAASTSSTDTHTERFLLDELDIDEQARDLFEVLLGRVRLVDDISAALNAQTHHPTSTFLTRTGAIVYSDGRVRVGIPGGVTSGALERKRTVRTLTTTIAHLEGELAHADEKLKSARAKLSDARDELAHLQGQEARLSGLRLAAAGEIARLAEQKRRAHTERCHLEHERTVAARTLEEIRPTLEQHAAAAKQASHEAQAYTRDIEELTAACTSARHAEQEASSSLSDTQLRLATVTERLRYLEKRESQLSSRVDELDGRIASLRSSAQALEFLVARVEPLHQSYEAIRDAAHVWAARLRDRASLASADSDSLKATVGDARKQVTEATSALEAARALCADLGVERGRLEVQVERGVERIREEGSLELEDALMLPELKDRTSLEESVVRLTSQIANIGPVNQIALEEYQTLKERTDYVEEQLKDLDEARRALTKIMNAIDRKIRRRFLVAFDEINKNFSSVFAMFFPGGSAHLELTDPTHPIDSGVEVIAQPRGKRLTKMSLMSGGERSLTALALLFALYRTRTVPFYVFDEVEAALDDANLGRFLNAIDQLKKSTQLIVISHQRSTMEKADVLFGVSMQSDGVSRAISQRLDRADELTLEA